MPKNSRSKTGGWPARFSSGSQHHEPDLHSEANLEKSWEYGKDLLACFADLEKVCGMTEFLG